MPRRVPFPVGVLTRAAKAPLLGEKPGSGVVLWGRGFSGGFRQSLPPSRCGPASVEQGHVHSRNPQRMFCTVLAHVYLNLSQAPARVTLCP